MKEKLIIKNFGPIKSVELELGKLTVLIGEQATGKSTVAKLLAVCRYFSYIINDNGVFSYPVENKFIEGLTAWGLNESVKEDSYIRYESKHYTLVAEYQKLTTVERNDDGEPFEYSENLFLPKLSNHSPEFKNLLKELEKIKPKSLTGEYGFVDLVWTIPTSFFQNDVAAVMDNPFFFHTERGLQSIFSLGKNTIPNINDSLFNQFARLDQIARSFTNETHIEPLNITYKNVAGKGYVRKSGEREYYSLANGASGYQSTIPLVLVMRHYVEIRRKSKTFIVEEPELNLFPSAQQKLMQFLVDKIMNHGNAALLTTHSPYMLTSLNNLIYAHKVGNDHNEEVKPIIEDKYWLNSSDVSVYMMLTNGNCEDVFDRTEGLIKAEKIDAVSGKLNKEFDELLNIEFVKE